MQPSLQNVLDQETLKWIFVGGKGGVGKTTTSCSLAVQLSAVRSSVLLISTDPAHNLSDAFNQKFGKDPTLVQGFSNLYAMEIDPNSAASANEDPIFGNLGGGGGGDPDNPNPMMSVMNEMSMALPGIDEAMGFAQVMKLIKSMEYSVIVFDTAPTGHTLRFLSFPSILEKALGKMQALSGRFGGIFGQLSSMFGINLNQDELLGRFRELAEVVSEVNRQFQNPDLTTFVAVCIAEFLSLYETERMIQELSGFNIDVHNIVVNQLIFPPTGNDCAQCNARRKMQKKYLDQMFELYEDFHLVQLPLQYGEIRGADALRSFSRYLTVPFQP